MSVQKTIPKIYNNKRRFEKWMDCDRCGFPFPYSYLSKDPMNGAIVCEGCIDEWSHTDYMARLRLPDESRTEKPGD